MTERWSIHYPMLISSNLVHRVMGRGGLRCEAASRLRRDAREPLAELSPMLIVADGGMLLTREESWKEAKVAVLARAAASMMRATWRCSALSRNSRRPWRPRRRTRG